MSEKNCYWSHVNLGEVKMLIQLHVKNLALIEEIEMEFGPG